MKTHHAPADRIATARKSVAGIMTLRPSCGARARSRGQLLISSDWSEVDCTRCREHEPAARDTTTELKTTSCPAPGCDGVMINGTCDRCDRTAPGNTTEARMLYSHPDVTLWLLRDHEIRSYPNFPGFYVTGPDREHVGTGDTFEAAVALVPQQ